MSKSPNAVMAAVSPLATLDAIVAAASCHLDRLSMGAGPGGTVKEAVPTTEGVEGGSGEGGMISE